QKTGIMLGNFYGIQIYCFSVLLFPNQSFQFDSQAENSDSDSVFIEYFVRFCKAVEKGVFKLIIGTQKWEFCLRKCFFKSFQAIVELVVSHGGSIISHHRHEFKFKFAAKKIKVRSSLKHISRIQKQNIFFFLSYLLNQCCSSRKSTLIGISGIRFIKRFNTAVLVIGMKNGDFISRSGSKDGIFCP